VGRVIVPAEITTILNNIKIANSSYRSSVNSAFSTISQFSNNQDLLGDSWTGIKNQLADYQTLLQGFLCVLDEVDEDCESLALECGLEDLYEEEIRAKIDQLQEINNSYYRSIDRMLHAAKHNPLASNNSFASSMIVGRRIAAENPSVSNEALADLVEQAVDNGEMLVIDANGDLAWSNDVPLGQCGHPKDDTAPLPGRPRDDFAVDTGSWI